MKILTLALLSFFLISCSFNKTYDNRKSDINEGEKVAIEFYSFIEENNRKEVFTLFSDRFFEEVSKEKFKQIIDKTENEFGIVKKYELVDSWSQIVTGSNPISKYEYSYLVTRDSMETKEYLKLQKENDTIKIINYRIDFDMVPKK